MRIYLKLSPNKIPVGFDYQVKLVGALHKWLGENKLHGTQSLYSMSWLSGGRADGTGSLQFPQGAEWFISAADTDFIKQVVTGIMRDGEVAYGMQVADIGLSESPSFEGRQCFRLGSPVLVKRNVGERQHHYTFQEAEADELLTQSLQAKLAKAGLSTSGVQVRFDRENPKAKSKVATYKSVKNRVNYCPVIIEGSPEQLAFAWNVGVGNSTGIGFGSLI